MLINTLLYAVPIATASRCPSLLSMNFWSVGHAVTSCTEADNFKSICNVQCEAPYVSVAKKAPHDSWEVQCKGALPTWKSVWTQRPDNNCYFCPNAHLQEKGARLIGGKYGGWKDGSGKTIGKEIRIRFDTESLKESCRNGFIFALRFKDFALPNDVTINVPGATVTKISPNRKLVTLEPNSEFAKWDHDFWNKGVHDGTRAWIYASDLDNFNGQWSVENFVICQNFSAFGQTVTDMTCLTQPDKVGTPFISSELTSCPTTTIATTTTLSSPTTTTTTTTTIKTTTGTTTTSSSSCDLGADLNPIGDLTVYAPTAFWGNCDFPWSEMENTNHQGMVYFAAVPKLSNDADRWQNGANCGRCIKVRCSCNQSQFSGACQPGGKDVIVQVVDSCPSCPAHDDLDLSHAAWNTITNDAGFSRYDGSWKYVKCPTDFISGVTKLRLKQGSSIWWLAVQPFNFRNKITAVEIVGQPNNHNNKQLDLGQIDAYWFINNELQYPVVLPLTFKVTNSLGASVQYSYSTITNDLVSLGVLL